MTTKLVPEYARSGPSNQTMVDIFKGAWNARLPEQLGVVAGESDLFQDSRVKWVVERMPASLEGLSVLELGPFEAYHTYHLQQAGVRDVVAIEGNSVSFLKCLVVKELLGLTATFRYGEFNAYLCSTEDRFDLCFASGVLYHQTDPLDFLARVSRLAPRLFLWTHYFDSDVIDGEGYPHFKPERDVDGSYERFQCRYHHRSYLSKAEERWAGFSGGSAEYAYWLEREDLLRFLDVIGFSKIEIGPESKDHSAGPTIALLATQG